jgi:hypothetical protein
VNYREPYATVELPVSENICRTNVDTGDSDADGAVVMRISQIQVLELLVVPGDVERQTALPHIEIAGIEIFAQQVPDFVGIAGIDEGEAVQRMTGKRFAHLMTVLFLQPQ